MPVGRKKLNLTGNKYGMLTVVRELEYMKTKSSIRFWLCKCDCGGERIVAQTSLTKGIVTNCGCQRSHTYTGIRAHRLYDTACRKCMFYDETRNRCTVDEDVGHKECRSKVTGPIDHITGKAVVKQSKCLICGGTVYHDNNEDTIYCYKHRDQAVKDRYVLQHLSNEAADRLCEEILRDAKGTYINARACLLCKDLSKRQKERYEYDIDECVKFLNSQWITIILRGVEINPQEVIEAWDEEAFESADRRAEYAAIRRRRVNADAERR